MNTCFFDAEHKENRANAAQDGAEEIEVLEENRFCRSGFVAFWPNKEYRQATDNRRWAAMGLLLVAADGMLGLWCEELT